jgi:hypothetical protein
MQATWQALQPMHLDSSMSLATCGTAERTCGEGVVVAERATTFCDCMTRHRYLTPSRC